MRKFVIPALAASALVAGCAQAPSTGEYEPGLHPVYAPPGPVAIDGGVRSTAAYISPDHPFVTDYVLRRPVGSAYDDGVAVEAGVRLPDEIRLLEVPSTGYAYTMINGKTVLVDPQRRRIVKVYPSG